MKGVYCDWCTCWRSEPEDLLRSRSEVGWNFFRVSSKICHDMLKLQIKTYVGKSHSLSGLSLRCDRFFLNELYKKRESRHKLFFSGEANSSIGIGTYLPRRSKGWRMKMNLKMLTCGNNGNNFTLSSNEKLASISLCNSPLCKRRSRSSWDEKRRYIWNTMAEKCE